ncbi:Gfo/Idh/MocA family protein [Paenibacillus piri]|uniref:Gfo/Idh/MocA family oxidoreductase n=1 Tax=Paenibacillus piri TaxID=2547395 RepID=A0A4R5KWE9_9BACL|nr:Gfo/Idh/MocA family oxidoreductase [Paenibacillus piri]TDG00342.1 Gfo/Idh/MocA family oxidoreductase [Paenibacillus piri]
MSLKIGFVGTGSFTRFHCDLLAKMDGVQVAAFCATSLDKAEKAAAGWNGAGAYDSVASMLDSQRLDAVYVCVPPMAHGEIEMTLIERGIPFFVEKPLGLDIELPAQIADKLAARKLITSVGYHFRYMDSTQRALELLQQRKVGMALGYWMGSMPKVGWWRRQDGSGGQFIEQTSHIVDLMRYLIGDVEEVYAAYASRVMHEVEEGVTVPDVGTVTFKLASGAVATISNACMLPGNGPTGLQIYTNQGLLELTRDSLKDAGKSTISEYKNEHNPYVREHEAFLHAVRTGDASRILSPYADSLKTQAVTAAAARSAATGQPVRVGPYR